ncbi:MAG: hypothetical protein AAFX50_24410 [Acidobacteriota bacterium]
MELLLVSKEGDGAGRHRRATPRDRRPLEDSRRPADVIYCPGQVAGRVPPRLGSPDRTDASTTPR